MGPRDAAGSVQVVTNVLEPEDLAVGGVEERGAVAVEVAGAHAGVEPAGVALGLGQDVLRAEGDLLGLDDARDAVSQPKGVVRGAVRGLLFLGPPGVATTQAPSGPVGPRVRALGALLRSLSSGMGGPARAGASRRMMRGQGSGALSKSGQAPVRPGRHGAAHATARAGSGTTSRRQ